MDETITDIYKLKYVAFVSHKKIIKFQSLKNLKVHFEKNKEMIFNDKVRELAGIELKSRHLKFTGITKSNFHSFIVPEEVVSVEMFHGESSKIEIVNRKIALEELITKTEATIFYIDDYSNTALKLDIKNHATEIGKRVYFVDSKSLDGVMLADIFLDFY